MHSEKRTVKLAVKRVKLADNLLLRKTVYLENLLGRKAVHVSRKFAAAKNGPVGTKFAAAKFLSPIVSVLVWL